MKVIGIDVGKSGGTAIIDGDEIRLYPYSTVEDFVEMIQREAVGSCKIAVENVHASPRMGVSSAFTFGQNFGEIKGALRGMGRKFMLIEPLRWQSALGCRSGGDKGLLREKAKEVAMRISFTLPDRFTLKTCDALLIAYYRKKVYDQQSKED